MNSHKQTKRALLTSVMALVMCVVMLVGTTFAWFTDTASTNVNTIKAGNLDVQLLDESGNPVEGETLNFLQTDANGNVQANANILWEPGATYQLPKLTIKNAGNLALKYKIAVSGAKVADGAPESSLKLLDVLEWTYEVDGVDYALDSEKHLTAKGTANDSDTLTIKATMDKNANNDYQNMAISGIAITVYATQDTVEYDSNGNTYDKDAAYPTYPAGLTKDSFSAGEKAVDSNGNFYTSFKEAMENVADNGTLYFKEDEVVDFGTHLDVTKNVTIYGNGADFSGKDISIGTYKAPANKETTINIYNAKNLVVWGQPTTNLSDDCTWNVNFYNCTNDNYNFLMYRGGETATAKINLTLENCNANGFADSIVHTTADGTITIKNCTFSNNCAPVNIAHKQAGAMTVIVENSKFINCGKIDTANDYFAPARFVNNSTTGTLTVNLTNNTFTGTIGTNGDILLGDYRTGKESHALTATITTANPVMVKSSTDAAYSYDGGTITLN